jgi:hypothetical protein
MEWGGLALVVENVHIVGGARCHLDRSRHAPDSPREESTMIYETLYSERDAYAIKSLSRQSMPTIGSPRLALTSARILGSAPTHPTSNIRAGRRASGDPPRREGSPRAGWCMARSIYTGTAFVDDQAGG